MLPFLKNKNQGASSGVIMKTREPDESQSPDDTKDSMQSLMQDLITAIHRHDVSAAAIAFKAAMDCPDSQEEENSVSPHTYDDQTQED